MLKFQKGFKKKQAFAANPTSDAQRRAATKKNLSPTEV
jgi:hypothetical protein